TLAELSRAGRLIRGLHRDLTGLIEGPRSSRTPGVPRHAPDPFAQLHFLHSLTSKAELVSSEKPASFALNNFDPEPRFKRQFDQLADHTQKLVRESANARQVYWAKADLSSVERWQESTKAYREHFAKELIGEFDIPLSPPNVRTRQVYDEPTYTG